MIKSVSQSDLLNVAAQPKRLELGKNDRKHILLYLIQTSYIKKDLECKVVDRKWVIFAYWWSSIGEGLLPTGLSRLVFTLPAPNPPGLLSLLVVISVRVWPVCVYVCVCHSSQLLPKLQLSNLKPHILCKYLYSTEHPTFISAGWPVLRTLYKPMPMCKST